MRQFFQINDLFFVEIPKDATEIDNNFGGMIFLKRNLPWNNTKKFFYLPKYMAYANKKILGRTDTMTEQEIYDAGLVTINDEGYHFRMLQKSVLGHISRDVAYSSNNCKEAFKETHKAFGMDPEKAYLIMKKL